MRNIGIIGYGKIGGAVVAELRSGPSSRGNRVSGVLARTGRHDAGLRITADPEVFFAARHDLIIEVAGPSALASLADRALSVSDVWSISPSALADAGIVAQIRQTALAHGHHLRILSGATAGLDGIAGAAVHGAPLTLKVHVRSDQGPGVLFEGSVREALKRFPHTINIAAAAALAGPGLDDTRIQLRDAAPGQERVNQIDIHSPVFRLQVQTASTPPAPGQPSATASSVIAALRALDQPIRFG